MSAAATAIADGAMIARVDALGGPVAETNARKAGRKGNAGMAVASGATKDVVVTKIVRAMIAGGTTVPVMIVAIAANAIRPALAQAKAVHNSPPRRRIVAAVMAKAAKRNVAGADGGDAVAEVAVESELTTAIANIAVMT